MHKDCGIKTYHIPYLPRRIYVEASGIAQIQEVMKFSVYNHLVSRATRILDDINRNFLHSANVPDVPRPGSWVRVVQAGIYKGDLALVLFAPSEGDIVSIGVVPRFDVSGNRKRKGSESRAAPAPTLLDQDFVWRFPQHQNGTHSIGSRFFLPIGLEVLQAPSAHALKIEPHPSAADLELFQSCFERLDATSRTEALIVRAMKQAFHDESRRLWHMGDRVRILEGSYMDMSCFIHEIDEANHSAIVELSWPTLTRVEVHIKDLERQFLVGDQVRVALGKNRGRTGSILEITNDVGTIVEGTANELVEVTPFFIFLHLLIILSSSMYYYYILRAIPLAFLSPLLHIPLLHPQASPSHLTYLRLQKATRR